MPDYEEAVVGRMVSEKGNPLEGVQVHVYDKDPLFDDALGSAVTDGEGMFRVEYTWSDYKAGEALEGRPDLYVTYTDPASGKSGKSDVVEEAKGQLSDDDSLEVINLGDIVVK
jgi:hypothetical protein